MTRPGSWRAVLALSLAGAAVACASDSSIDDSDAPGWTTHTLTAQFPALADVLSFAPKCPPARSPVSGLYRIRPAEGCGAAHKGFGGVELPASAHGWMRAHLTGGGSIRVRRVGARSAPARRAGDTVTYDQGVDGVDSVVFATERGVEELLIAEREHAELTYEFELPRSWSLFGISETVGIVEVRDASHRALLRLRAERAWGADGREVPIQLVVNGANVRLSLGEVSAWPVAVDPAWEGTDSMVITRQDHTATLLPNGLVLIAGGTQLGSRLAELYDPISATFRLTSESKHHRVSHSASRLRSGQVILTGGLSTEEVRELSSAELYDPATEQFTETGSMAGPRMDPALMLLPDGTLLVAGGDDATLVSSALDSAELYDPVAGAFYTVDAMSKRRSWPACGWLPDGKVLMAGGKDENGATRVAELFDPTTKQFEPTGTTVSPHALAAVLPLPDGNVLVAGGGDDQGNFLAAEIYDASAGTFRAVSDMHRDHFPPIGALLPSGRVFLTGRAEEKNEPSELFDPISESFSDTDAAPSRFDGIVALLGTGAVLTAGGSLAGSVASANLYRDWPPMPAPSGDLYLPLVVHAAVALPDGRVVVAGGVVGVDDNGQAVGNYVFLFDPTSLTFGEGPTTPVPYEASGVLLPDERVLVVGLKSFVFDPVTSSVTEVVALNNRRSTSPIVLADGRVLVAGGVGTSAGTASAVVFDPTTLTVESVGDMSVRRSAYAAARLPLGEVLIAGGINAQQGLRTSEIFDPVTSSFRPTTSLPAASWFTSAAPLPNGTVLVAGVVGGNVIFDPALEQFIPAADLSGRTMPAIAQLEDGRVVCTGGVGPDPNISRVITIFDPVTRTYAPAGDMAQPRFGHTATALADGRVLIAGGAINNVDLGTTESVETASAELFDPATGISTPLWDNVETRPYHRVSILATGEVLNTGGLSLGSSKADLVDPVTRTSKPLPPMAMARTGHTSTVLGSWDVLIAGGQYWEEPTATAELFHAASRSFSQVSPMQVERTDHAATLLPSGKVLVTGGMADATVESFDPATGAFEPAGSITFPRIRHGAALLSTGEVLIAGGVDASGALVTALEVFDPRQGSSRRIETAPTPSGPCVAAPVANGDVIVVDASMAFRFRPGVDTLEVIPEPIGASPILSLWTGESLHCDNGATMATSCATLGVGEARSFVLPFAGPAASAVVMKSGDVFVQAVRTEGIPYAGVIETTPPGVVRPSVANVEARVRIGARVHVTGSRFMHLSAAGSEALPAYPNVMPLVAFMPLVGGGPLYGRVVEWTDTDLEFIVPSTTYHGPGWLHVIVEGVPSEGAAVVVEPRELAEQCAFDGECGSGYCIEGVCCENRCEANCLSCLSRITGGDDGRCLPVPLGQDPKEGCAVDDLRECKNTGECDGEGACEQVADGTLCEPDKRCKSRTCTATLGQPCTATADCALNQVCAVDRTCKKYLPSDTMSDPGACSTTPRPQSGLRAVWMLAALAGLVALRRKDRRYGAA